MRVSSRQNIRDEVSASSFFVIDFNLDLLYLFHVLTDAYIYELSAIFRASAIGNRQRL